MLKQRREKQQQMELVIMEQMVPEDHFLRKVDRAVDFSFIYDLCAPLYCADNGRPAIDPEILFRMLLVGYLYGIKSEARLEEEINYNIAYKWFCGLDLTDKAPDATTISQNRRRRFRDNNIAEEIFNEILRQCAIRISIERSCNTDSTHIKAKANKHRKKLVEVAVTPRAYLSELDAQVDQERKELGKKPFDRDDEAHKGGGSGHADAEQDRPGEWTAEPGWETERVLLQRTPHGGQQAQCNRKRACGSGKHQRRDAGCPKYSTRWREDLGSCPSTWDWTRDTTTHG